MNPALVRDFSFPKASHALVFEYCLFPRRNSRLCPSNLSENTQTMKNDLLSPKAKSAPALSTPPDFTPGPTNQATAQQYFDRGAKKAVESNRWFLIALVLAVGHVLQGAAWNGFLPLKSVETYVVNQGDKGRLVADGTPVGTWTPDDDAIDYFVNQWASKTWDVNRATIESTFAESSELVVGTAKVQLQELRSKDNPLVSLHDNPGYSRTYEMISINKIKDDVRLLRFRTVTRLSPDSAPTITTYAMTVTNTRVKPRTRAEVMKNPAGIFITSFNPTEESVSK
jgi:type IV secretory pathway component VirB8